MAIPKSLRIITVLLAAIGVSPSASAQIAARMFRYLLARRKTFGVHADGAGLPQLEALPRRLGAGPDALRSENLRDEEHHVESRERRTADVARRHDLLRVRPRRERAEQHLGVRG